MNLQSVVSMHRVLSVSRLLYTNKDIVRDLPVRIKLSGAYPRQNGACSPPRWLHDCHHVHIRVNCPFNRPMPSLPNLHRLARRLWSLDIRSWRKTNGAMLVDRDTVESIVVHHPQLRDLTLHNTAAIPSTLATLTHLRHLDVSGCGALTDSLVEALSTLPHLESFACGRCRLLTDAALTSLVKCTTLRRLAFPVDGLGRQQFTDTGFVAIGECTRLQSLDMSWNSRYTITNAAFVHLAKCVHLQELDIHGCDQHVIHDGAFAHIAKLSKLQRLNMSSCSQRGITDSAFAHLRRCTKLVHLDMSGCFQDTITDSAFHSIAALHQLQHLALEGCYQEHITDAAFDALAKGCPGLQHLNMGMCSQRTITDLALEYLARGCRMIQHLNLRTCSRRISSDVIEHLTTMTTLRSLNVADCGFLWLHDPTNALKGWCRARHVDLVLHED